MHQARCLQGACLAQPVAKPFFKVAYNKCIRRGAGDSSSTNAALLQMECLSILVLVVPCMEVAWVRSQHLRCGTSLKHSLNIWLVGPICMLHVRCTSCQDGSATVGETCLVYADNVSMRQRQYGSWKLWSNTLRHTPLSLKLQQCCNK